MRIPKSKPFAFGLVFSCAKTSFSDLLVQKVIEGREEIDWNRNSVFAAFGFADSCRPRNTYYLEVLGYNY